MDTDGLILKVRVHAASVQDRDGAALVLDQLDEPLAGIQCIWADGGYAGPKLQDWMRQRFAGRTPRLEIVRRSDTQKGFAVLPRRWVVERTFSWLTQHRRLARDYERTESSAEAWIDLAMIRVQLRRLA